MFILFVYYSNIAADIVYIKRNLFEEDNFIEKISADLIWFYCVCVFAPVDSMNWMSSLLSMELYRKIEMSSFSIDRCKIS